MCGRCERVTIVTAATGLASDSMLTLLCARKPCVTGVALAMGPRYSMRQSLASFRWRLTAHHCMLAAAARGRTRSTKCHTPAYKCHSTHLSFAPYPETPAQAVKIPKDIRGEVMNRLKILPVNITGIVCHHSRGVAKHERAQLPCEGGYGPPDAR